MLERQAVRAWGHASHTRVQRAARVGTVALLVVACGGADEAETVSPFR